ncbi:MAG TPA: hypothetical protein VEX16_05590 [Methyloceanibacter sp.]|nr:hypothetical protein [Methyloceanibacter sp.]
MTFARPSLNGRPLIDRRSGRGVRKALPLRGRPRMAPSQAALDALNRIAALARQWMLVGWARQPDLARLLSTYRQAGVAVVATLAVWATFEAMQPTPATWVALPESRAGSDWAAFPAPPSPAHESKASRRFRTVFEDPAQPLFSRIAALNPALFSLPAAGEAEERRDLVADADGFEAGAKEMLRDTVQAAASAEANPSISFAGIWAPSASACSPKSNNRQLLPAVINEEGAWAGEVSCRFRRYKQAGNTALITSTCTDGRQRWTANIRLAVDGDRLVWSSERGSQTYVRCDSRIVEARAGM